MTFLTPEESPFDTLPVLARYYRLVASKLLPEESSHTIAVAVCLPSFQCEWAIRLHGTKRRGYTVTVSQVVAPLWGKEDESARAPTSQHSLDVSHEFAGALEGALTKALLTVANTNRRPCGLDGVTYHFVMRHPQLGRIGGQTWSPQPSTMAGRLVDLIERLRRRIQGDPSAECFIDSIAADLQRFEVPPPFRPTDKQIEGLAQQTSRFVKLYTTGVISAEELVTSLSEAWENHGFPNPGDVIRLLAAIPAEIQTRMRQVN